MPAFSHGKGAKFFIKDSSGTERDISNTISQIELPRTADTAEVSSLGDAAKNFVAGLKDSTGQLELSRDATVEGYLDGLVGVQTTYTYFPEGSATGKVVFAGTAIGTQFSETSAISDANKASFAWQGCGTVSRNLVP